jgi:hypothetical protein
MWIVLLKNKVRHSAWLTKGQAVHQLEVLRDAGVIKLYNQPLKAFITFDDTVSCEDGHYYV